MNEQQAQTPYVGTHTELEPAQRALAHTVHDAGQGAINLVTPSHVINVLPPFRALSIQRAEPLAEQLYPLPGGGGGLEGIAKAFLDVLKALRGIQVLETFRSDDGAIDCLWQYTCRVAVPDFSGQVTVVTKSRELDLRDGSPEAERALGRKRNPASLQATRINAPAVCESKAQNRAVREALGIRGAMGQREFLRPWIVCTLVQHVDPRMLSQDAIDDIGRSILGGEPMAMYGRRRSPAAEQLPPSSSQPATTEPSTPSSSPSPQGPPPVAGGTPPAAGPSSPPRRPEVQQEVRPAMADAQQLSVLTEWWNHYGEERFRGIAQRTLGREMPGRHDLAHDDADRLIAAMGAESPGF